MPAQPNFIEFPNIGLLIPLERVAFSFFGLPIYFYGIIICAAIVLGISYAIKSAKRVGLLSDSVFDAAFWGVLFGVIGARTYFVIFSATDYSLGQAAFGLRDGGLAFYGGVIGAVIGSAIAFKFRKMPGGSRVPFSPVLDLIGIGFPLGLGIGRWGNFVNQEAFGAPTAGNLPWGMSGSIIRGNSAVIEAVQAGGDFDSVLVHPCFLYESLWCLLGFGVLHFYSKKLQTFDGEMFLLFLVWYGSGRAFIESLRMDSLMVGDLRVSQMVSIIAATVALCLFAYFKVMRSPKYAYARFKHTSASEKALSEHRYRTKLEKEKERALTALRRGQRELNDPFEE
ncbi:MAG: prolipoprotein diacylglyceryl transferase [Oscillospiraceae bacterium]|nr:prolipoprotein diacylglyceryl transferase [Oscillospiraceae bacterium]